MGPSGAGAFGMAAYANVPTRPTKSRNALSERFIQLLSLGSSEATSNSGASSVGGIIHNARRGAFVGAKMWNGRKQQTIGGGRRAYNAPGVTTKGLGAQSLK